MSYPQYPRSNFPEQVDDFATMQDPTASLMTIISQYQTLISNNKYDDAAVLLGQYPDLDKSQFNAAKFNQLSDGLKAVQQFFRDDVEGYVTDLYANTVGINDKATGNARLTNAYSVSKVDDLIGGLKNAVVVTLPVSGWSSASPYTQKVAVSGIKETDSVGIHLYSPHGIGSAVSNLRRKMSCMITDGESSDGYMTFYCEAKKPTSDFPILLTGVSLNG